MALADEFDQLLLVFRRVAGEEVDQAVGVGRDEVEWAGIHLQVRPARLDRGVAEVVPPLPGNFIVVGGRAAEDADGEMFLLCRDPRELRQTVPIPEEAQPLPIGVIEAERCLDVRDDLRERWLVCAVRQEGVAQAGCGEQETVELVPLDLVGDQHRDQIIDVGGGGDHHGEGVDPVIKHQPSASGRADPLPAEDIGVARPREDRLRLPEEDQAHARRSGRAGAASSR